MKKKPIPEAVKEYLAEIGKKGGSAKSEKKTDAVRLNAKLGGWPKGVPRGPRAPRPAGSAGGRKKKAKS